MNIFVGNLSFVSTEEEVKRIFLGFGTVASIVIVKDKKGKKSRGFGFVEMPDEQEAQAAINALNEKEFMGRVLKVEASRPKIEIAGDINRKEKMGQSFKVKILNSDLDDKSVRQDKPQLRTEFVRTGRYRGGRRTQSFMRKRLEAGIEEPVIPKRRFKENPMRWRKKREYSKPWQKNRGEAKPWQKKEGEFKPQEKTGVESKPWKKSPGARKPSQKNRGEAKPWQKKEGEFKPQEKTGVESKPWKKSPGAGKPWQKTASRKRPFHFKERKVPEAIREEFEELRMKKKKTVECHKYKCKTKGACCRMGAWVDLEEAKKILALGIKGGDFFHLEKDCDYPSGYKVGTSIEDEPCTFITPEGLCAIHKIDYGLKPAHCKEFPYENGRLSSIAKYLCVVVKARHKKKKSLVVPR